LLTFNAPQAAGFDPAEVTKALAEAKGSRDGEVFGRYCSAILEMFVESSPGRFHAIPG